MSNETMLNINKRILWSYKVNWYHEVTLAQKNMFPHICAFHVWNFRYEYKKSFMWHLYQVNLRCSGVKALPCTEVWGTPSQVWGHHNLRHDLTHLFSREELYCDIWSKYFINYRVQLDSLFLGRNKSCDKCVELVCGKPEPSVSL